MRWRDSDVVSRMKATDSLKLYSEMQFLIIDSFFEVHFGGSSSHHFQDHASVILLVW